MKKIDKKIKELYNNDKALFAQTIDVTLKNLASKIKTLQSKIDWCNDFLKHLNLKIKIVNKRKSD